MGVKYRGSKLSDLVIKKSAKLQSSYKVIVGIPIGARDSLGNSTALIAAYNEYGTEHIPARPAFRTTYTENIDRWTAFFDYYLKQTGDMQKACQALALVMQGDLKDSLNQWSEPSNAPSTIKHKGFDNPWIWTGNLLNSIEWQVIKL